MTKSAILWSIKEIVEELTYRVNNEFDANFLVTGPRGNGKSTFIFKTLNRIKIFKPKKHIAYNRDEVIDLLKNQQKSICWDDEAINSGYKRDFQNKGQKELIKMVTAYRDNFNIYASAVPNFFSLDKDLRDLIFMHIHIIERGFAAIFMPLGDTIFSRDKWDTNNNQKLESKWQERRQRNPNFKFPYHEMSTFVGYIYFGPLSKKQEKLYKQIKREKRKEGFLTEEEKKNQKELSYLDKIYNLLIEGKLSKEGMIQICAFHGKKQTQVNKSLNERLRDDNKIGTVRDYLVKTTAERKMELKLKRRNKKKSEIDEFLNIDD